jgi:MFS family permease
MISLCWAVGILSGPFVGGAFAQNPHTTWRWVCRFSSRVSRWPEVPNAALTSGQAFYILLPFQGVLMFTAILLLPNYNTRRNLTLRQSLRSIDWVGSLLHIACCFLFATVFLLSGNNWKWSSGSAIALWVFTGLAFIAYVAQQYFSLFTTPECRAFPVKALVHRTAGLAMLGCLCSSMAYGVSLYYLPLFFGFARGASPVEAAVHIIPFVGVLIGTIVVSSAMLPRVGYYASYYVASGALLVVGGALMAQITTSTHDSAILGYEALLGVGVGLVLTNSFSIANASLRDPHDKLASAALYSMVVMAGIAVALPLAGCIYQNVGFRDLQEILRPLGFSERDIREALAGVASPVFEIKDQAVVEAVIGRLTRVLARLFYITAASGVLCLLIGLCMRWEKLDFKQQVPHTAENDEDTDSLLMKDTENDIDTDSLLMTDTQNY